LPVVDLRYAAPRRPGPLADRFSCLDLSATRAVEDTPDLLGHRCHIACKASKRLVPCVVYRSTERRIKFAYMVAMILQLSYLTHAESIHDVWDKADAWAPWERDSAAVSLSTTEIGSYPA